MAKPLRIFTDGSYNWNNHTAGWAYVIVSGDTVLFADCGIVEGVRASSGTGEHLAVMYALLALPTQTNVQVVSDLDVIVGVVNGLEFKRKYRQLPNDTHRLQDIIRRLCHTHNVRAEQIKSGRHPYNRYADTLARRACGLPPKPSRNQIRNKKRRLQHQLDRERRKAVGITR